MSKAQSESLSYMLLFAVLGGLGLGCCASSFGAGLFGAMILVFLGMIAYQLEGIRRGWKD